MSVQNGERLVTKQDLADMYQGILPYLGGMVTSKAGFTPIGTIISVMGTTAPVNYLACDGTVYNIADYTELANYFNEQFGSKNFFGGNGTTTFAVPDLRGEFLRGTGTNSHTNQGDGASVGVHQDATEIPRSYGYLSSSTNTVGITGAVNSTSAIAYLKADSEQEISGGTNIYANGTKQTATARMFTSRPTNTSVLFCIATKNFYIDPTLDYSTDEKIVGTWITGKPLYQKTIQLPSVVTTTSSGWTTLINVSSLNVATLITTTLADITDNMILTGNLSTVTSGELRVSTIGYTFPCEVVTIQYTKTT